MSENGNGTSALVVAPNAVPVLADPEAVTNALSIMAQHQAALGTYLTSSLDEADTAPIPGLGDDKFLRASGVNKVFAALQVSELGYTIQQGDPVVKYGDGEQEPRIYARVVIRVLDYAGRELFTASGSCNVEEKRFCRMINGVLTRTSQPLDQLHNLEQQATVRARRRLAQMLPGVAGLFVDHEPEGDVPEATVTGAPAAPSEPKVAKKTRGPGRKKKDAPVEAAAPAPTPVSEPAPDAPPAGDVENEEPPAAAAPVETPGGAAGSVDTRVIVDLVEARCTEIGADPMKARSALMRIALDGCGHAAGLGSFPATRLPDLKAQIAQSVL